MSQKTIDVFELGEDDDFYFAWGTHDPEEMRAAVASRVCAQVGEEEFDEAFADDIQNAKVTHSPCWLTGPEDEEATSYVDSAYSEPPEGTETRPATWLRT